MSTYWPDTIISKRVWQRTAAEEEIKRKSDGDGHHQAGPEKEPIGYKEERPTKEHLPQGPQG